MAGKDIHTRIFPDIAFNVELISSNGTYNGNIIDLFGFDSVSFIFLSGQFGGSTIDVILEHDDNANFSTATQVTSDYLIGTLPNFINDEINVVKKVGYVGKKRYVRASIIATNHTGVFAIFGVALKGDANEEPTQ